MIRIGIFGCTGSIGQNTIDIVKKNSDRVRITALAVGSREDELLKLSQELGVERLAMGSVGKNGTPHGPQALRSLAASKDLDLVVNAVVGAAGLSVTLGALDSGNNIALANKESLVMAGDLVMNLARENGVEIRPIDSEHAALANCLKGRKTEDIRRVYLTASGGPFRGRKAGSFDQATIEEALNHPTWKMGPKITIDSATLMNKALEIIEAYHLFDLSSDMIKVVVHPQSIIHAMVEHRDGSLIAELAPADMRIPIQRAILDDGKYSEPLDLLKLNALTFEEVDREAFPMIDLAYSVLERGGTSATVINAANEVAVMSFLEGQIKFGDITNVILRTFDAAEVHTIENEERVYEADSWARRFSEDMISSGMKKSSISMSELN